MPDMDGFILLEFVGLEMDLPVIMMSVDGETRRVMKGVQHGACDYLLKPIRMKELRNIWQHVLRKRILEVKDIENYESIQDVQMWRNESDHYFDNGDLTNLVRKRKDFDDKEVGDHSSSKKARVFWTVDLHQKFVRAVNQIGFDKIGPKKILDLMNIPWLTRENVASHLQKYRLYLSRLEKESHLKVNYTIPTQEDLFFQIKQDEEGFTKFGSHQIPLVEIKHSSSSSSSIIEKSSEVEDFAALGSSFTNHNCENLAISGNDGSTIKWLEEGDYSSSNSSSTHGFELGNLDFLDYNDATLLLSSSSYDDDALRFDYDDYPSDLMEYPLIFA